MVNEGPERFPSLCSSYDMSAVKKMFSMLNQNIEVTFSRDPLSCIFFFRPFVYDDEEEGLELVAGLVTTVSAAPMLPSLFLVDGHVNNAG
jgi:hypothetical protein